MPMMAMTAPVDSTKPPTPSALLAWSFSSQPEGLRQWRGERATREGRNDVGAHRDRSLLTAYYPGPGPDRKLRWYVCALGAQTSYIRRAGSGKNRKNGIRRATNPNIRRAEKGRIRQKWGVCAARATNPGIRRAEKGKNRKNVIFGATNRRIRCAARPNCQPACTQSGDSVRAILRAHF
jgi:hypothetical protein